MKQKKKFTLARRRAITGLLFVSPWIIGFFTYYVKSLYQTIYMAFSDVTQAETGGFVSTLKGIDNFKYAFLVDAEFDQILVTSVKDILIDVPLIIFFSLFWLIGTGPLFFLNILYKV